MTAGGQWKDKPATEIQLAFVKALSGREDDDLTRGKATSIVRNKLNKMRKKVKKRGQRNSDPVPDTD